MSAERPSEGARPPLRRSTLVVAWLTGAAALGAFFATAAGTSHAAGTGSATAQTGRVALAADTTGLPPGLLSGLQLAVSTPVVSAPSANGSNTDGTALAADAALATVGTGVVQNTATRSAAGVTAVSDVASASVSLLGASVLSTGALEGQVSCPTGGPASASTSAASVKIGGRTVDASVGATASVAVSLPPLIGADVQVTVSSPHSASASSATASGLTVSFTLTGRLVTGAVSVPLGSVVLASTSCTAPSPAAPTISGLSPVSGPVAGGTVVTIDGTGFGTTPSVTFDGVAATDVSVDPTGTEITATTPAHVAGAVDVVVTGPGGSVTDGNGFTYVAASPAAPTISGLSPVSGPVAGGTVVTIDGTGFGSSPSVTFDGVAATDVSVDPTGTEITATTPAHVAGPVDVVVTGPGGSVTDGDGFTYVAPSPAAPTVSGLSPVSGPVAGGTVVTIDGTGFGSSPSVTFDGLAATDVSVDPTGTEITVTSPAHVAGPVDVVVTGSGGSATDSGGFTYVAPSPAVPTISGLNPVSGPVAGGTVVTIDGTGFGTSPLVTFDGAAATDVSVDPTGTEITVTTPAHVAGPVDVVVTGPGGSTTDSGGFTYVAPSPAAPTVSGLTPTSGPVVGGTTVTIDGTGFGSSPSVTFDGVAATDVSVDPTGTEITATTPAHNAGPVDVVVTGPGGSTTDSGGFTYLEAPTISSLTPVSGPTAGGTTVTIDGTSFGSMPSVTFDGVPGYDVVVDGLGTSLMVTTPVHPAGLVDVVVTGPGGSTTDSGGFTYVAPSPAAPTISGLSPVSGPVAGGTVVTIDGTGFGSSSSVTFDGLAATDVSVDPTGTEITATTPAHAAGPVDVVVSGPGGSVTDSGGFTYVAPSPAAPTVSGLSPDQGPVAGGTTVTIDGTGFGTSPSVTFDGVAATDVSVDPSGTEITATTPAHVAGAVDVVVTGPGGSSTVTAAYTYVATSPAAPTVSGLTPDQGPTAGGTVVTIDGTGFGSSPSVTFDGVAATDVSVDPTGTEITVTTPAHGAGPVDVVVTGPGGSTTDSGGFTYLDAPTISDLTPVSGPTAGGTTVTIDGTSFGPTPSVTFDGVPGYDVVVDGLGTSLTVTTPVHPAGPVDVVVTGPGGSTTDTAAYTYVAAPTVLSVDPAEGPTSGGTAVTVDGTGFGPATTITVGGVPATDVVVDRAGTSLTAVTPAGTAGPTDVVVSTDGGTATLPDGYTYVEEPAVTGIAPSSGPIAGGQPVTLSGSGFGTDPVVTIGGQPAVVVSVTDGTTIVATTPAHAAGDVDVVVTTPVGSATLHLGYRYVAAPTLTAVDPIAGPVVGGQAVTLSGTGFDPTSTVTIGGSAATDVVVVNDTTITATTPAGAIGPVDVTVSGPGGAATLPDGYTYLPAPPPGNLSIDPASGPSAGGQQVVISGTDLGASPTVTFGGRPATVLSVTDGSVTVLTPAGTVGTTTVVVSTAAGSGAPLSYRYLAPRPVIDGFSPHVGPTTGGQRVVVTGSNFGEPAPTAPAAGALRVRATASRVAPLLTFNGVEAEDVTVNAAGTELVLMTPPNTIGPAVVVIGEPGNEVTFRGDYTYVAPTAASTAPGTPASAAPGPDGTGDDPGLGGDSPESDSGGALPFTGLDVVGLVAGGLVLMVGGGVARALGSTRRRRR